MRTSRNILILLLLIASFGYSQRRIGRGATQGALRDTAEAVRYRTGIQLSDTIATIRAEHNQIKDLIADTAAAIRADFPEGGGEVTTAQLGDSTAAVRNHNHALSTLSEKSYNSLNDKPTIPSSTSQIAPSANRNYVTDVQATVIGNTSGTNTGDQTISLTTDVTGSGTTSFAATIAANAVTLAKMADVATGTVFYRKTAATGDPEVQTLATLKTDLGLTGTNSGDVTLAGQNYLTLSAQQITAAQINLTTHVTGDLPLANLAQASAASKLMGRGSAAGAGDFEEVTLGTNLSMSGTTLNATGGSGGGTLRVVLATPVLAALIWTNMPSAASFFLSTATVAKNTTKADLTNYTQVRLLVNKQGTSGAASSKLILRYKATPFTQTVANYVDIGTSEVSVATNVNNTFLATAWINLAAGAKADVFVDIVGSGGDGALDPAFGSVVAEFK